MMTPEELLKNCEEALSLAVPDEQAVIVIGIKNRKARGDRIRLFPYNTSKNNPVGAVVATDAENLWTEFSCQEIVDFLAPIIAQKARMQ